MKTALKNLVNVLSKGKLDFANANYNGLELVKKRFSERTIYYPVQLHNYTEIIFKTDGPLNILLDRHWRYYNRTKAITILPGINHTERYISKTSHYQLLWLIIAPTSAHAHITAYNPQKGYHIISRTPLLADNSIRQNMHQLAYDILNTNNRLDKIKFQAILIQIVCNSINNMDNHLINNISLNEQIVNQIKFYIDSHYSEQISLSKLATIAHYNSCYLNALFKKHIGTPINKYLTETRISKAEELLIHTNLEIKQIAYSVGFNDPLYFSRTFVKHRKISPSQFRSKFRNKFHSQIL